MFASYLYSIIHAWRWGRRCWALQRSVWHQQGLKREAFCTLRSLSLMLCVEAAEQVGGTATDEGAASSTAKHHSYGPPFLFLGHWTTHKCTFPMKFIRKEDLLFLAIWEGLLLGSGHGEGVPCPPSICLCSSQGAGGDEAALCHPMACCWASGQEWGCVLL